MAPTRPDRHGRAKAERAGGRPATVAHLDTFSQLKRALPDLLLASLVLNILAMALPLALLQVYDRIIPNRSEGTLGLLAAGLVVAILLEGWLRIARAHLTAWVGARFEHLAGCAALAHLLRARIEDLERDGSGVHLERLNALATVKELYSGQTLLTVVDLPFALLYLALIWAIAGPLVLVPIVLLLLFAAAAWLIGASMRRSLDRRALADERRLNFIIEVLTGIHTVKSMSMERLMLRRYERLQEGSAAADYDVAQENALALSLSTLFSQVTTVLVAAAGALIVIGGEMTVGGLAACTMLAGRSLQPIQKAMGVWTRFQSISLARARLAEIFALPPEAAPDLPALPPVAGRLHLEGVSFRYASEPDPLLDRLSLTVAEGECIGIAGGNGSGKSTLLALMSGALRPTGGRILVDGHDLGRFEPSSLKAQIAYLPQQGALFRGTILENIALFRPNLAEAAIGVAAQLGLDEVVRSMPQGYDTLVGEGSSDTLPRGIRQRIAVARALLPGPRIVLFDEANTGVDGAGDAYLKTCLERLKGQCTLVLVTHRPSLLRLADRIFQLEGGSLRLREQTMSAPAAAGGEPPSASPVVAPSSSPAPSLGLPGQHPIGPMPPSSNEPLPALRRTGS